MKKKVLAAILIAVGVLTGCGNSEPIDVYKRQVGCYQFYEVFIFSGIHNKILLKDIIIVP